jgi:hypothetical protein
MGVLDLTPLPLRYFAAVPGPWTLGLRISDYVSELQWSYGDSNPRPLACHPAATRPPACIGAGHRPRTSARVHRNPGLLRYFPAVSGARPGVASVSARAAPGSRSVTSATCTPSAQPRAMATIATSCCPAPRVISRPAGLSPAMTGHAVIKPKRARAGSPGARFRQPGPPEVLDWPCR